MIDNELSEQFERAFKALEAEQEAYWNSLSKENQLKAFCAVVRRLHKGELEHSGTYRYILYQVFGFGTEAYAQAQAAGFLALHNAIYHNDYVDKLFQTVIDQLNNPPLKTGYSIYDNGYDHGVQDAIKQLKQLQQQLSGS